MPHPLTRIPLTKSANVLSYQYCPTCQGLYIEFKGNKLYRYEGITEQEWIALRQAHSKGVWIQVNLKDMARPFKFLGVDRAEAAAANAG